MHLGLWYQGRGRSTLQAQLCAHAQCRWEGRTAPACPSWSARAGADVRWCCTTRRSGGSMGPLLPSWRWCVRRGHLPSTRRRRSRLLSGPRLWPRWSLGPLRVRGRCVTIMGCTCMRACCAGWVGTGSSLVGKLQSQYLGCCCCFGDKWGLALASSCCQASADCPPCLTGGNLSGQGARDSSRYHLNTVSAGDITFIMCCWVSSLGERLHNQHMC